MATLEKHSIEDLQKMIADKREALRVFRFEGAGSRTRDVRSGRNLRKEIAQALTEIKARDLSFAKARIASKKKTA